VRSYAQRGGTGYVLDTLWSAWDAFAGGESYADVFERAVRFGHDTDTTACVAGSLAGAFWGMRAIPPDWLNGMLAGNLVKRLVRRMAARSRRAT
jgi:ADP-ribosyl-[dinitrogen reductase] hydrolase